MQQRDEVGLVVPGTRRAMDCSWERANPSTKVTRTTRRGTEGRHKPATAEPTPENGSRRRIRPAKLPWSHPRPEQQSHRTTTNPPPDELQVSKPLGTHPRAACEATAGGAAHARSDLARPPAPGARPATTSAKRPLDQPTAMVEPTACSPFRATSSRVDQTPIVPQATTRWRMTGSRRA